MDSCSSEPSSRWNQEGPSERDFIQSRAGLHAEQGIFRRVRHELNHD